MLKKHIFVSAGTTLCLLSSIALAETINFPRGQTSGAFHCSYDTYNPLATVKIDTESVEVKGFCDGQPYVNGAGHIIDMPVYKLKNYYFEIKKEVIDSGSITITSSSGGLSCSVGKGNKSTSYGDGGYC